MLEHFVSDMSGHHLAAVPGADLPLFASAEQQCKLDIFRKLFSNHYLKASIWRSQNIWPPYSDSAWMLERLRGSELPAFARLDQAIMPGCQGANSRTWKLCDYWVLSRAFTVTHHPGTFFTSKTPSFSISAPSLVPLLISLRFLTPRNYGFNCL